MQIKCLPDWKINFDHSKKVYCVSFLSDLCFFDWIGNHWPHIDLHKSALFDTYIVFFVSFFNFPLCVLVTQKNCVFEIIFPSSISTRESCDFSAEIYFIFFFGFLSLFFLCFKIFFVKVELLFISSRLPME